MGRSWALAAGLLAVLLLAGAAFFFRSHPATDLRPLRESSLSGNPSTSPASAAPAAGGPPRPVAAGRIPSPPPSPLSGVLVAKATALGDLLEILETKGGAAALQAIRDAVWKPAKTLEDRLNQAFLARLIAHVATQDPSVTAAALELSREILQSTAVDPWARMQAAAGLGGLSSSTALPLDLPGRPASYLFMVQMPDATQEGPFEESLRDAARQQAAIGTALPAILTQEKESGVREALVRSIGEIGAAGSGEALRGAALSDPETTVRKSALESLERSAAPELGDTARRMARTDVDPDNQTVALDLLGRTSAADPATARFLADCLANQEPSGALPALTRSSFAALEASPSAALQDGLSQLLVQKAADPDVAESFAREAVDRGLPRFLPILRTLEDSLPVGSPSRQSLALAAKQLEDSPRYAAMAQRIKGVETETRTLMQESARPATSEPRRAEIVTRIGALQTELGELEGQLKR